MVENKNTKEKSSGLRKLERTTMNKRELEDFVTLELQEKSFEDVLESFDLTPQEVFVLLYNNGMIDDEILERA
jgi:3-oxoacyl-[acyl-carrier-protein] synthase III